MGGQVIEMSALYRAPVTVCAQRGSGRYHTTLASSDRLVLDVEDGDHVAQAEIGELVSIGCPDPHGWVTGEVRIVAQRGIHGLVTTAPELRIAQRRASHRVTLVLPVDICEIDDEVPEWVAGEPVDVSSDGFSAQVPPVGIVGGDRLGVRLALPDGGLVAGEVDVVAGGPLLRARWSVLSERDRDRITRFIHHAETGNGR